ncbi:MAG: WYL domain-containing protein [Lachnospiraceae bacterium]
MNRSERYELFQSINKEERTSSIVLTGLEQEFLENMLEMPESRMFLSETIYKKLGRYKKKTRENSNIDVLGEYKINPLWQDEDYIQNVKRAMKTVRRKEGFFYENQTNQGEVVEGIGYPVRIQVDVFTRNWYLHFVDIERKNTVLANLARCKIKYKEDSIVANEQIDDILDKRKKGVLKLKILNKKSAHERACLLFADNRRQMEYNKEEDALYMGITYYDYEEEGIIRKILSLGAFAVVLEPQNIRERIVKEVEQVLNIYHE